MAEFQYQFLINGQEVQKQDFNLLGMISGLADDRVFAEFLRLAPYDGTNVSKSIVPFVPKPSQQAPAQNATVASTYGTNATGSIIVNPFRAIVGSTVAVAVNAELQNWRDIRSGIFVNAGSGSLAKTFSLAANSSGNGRWDLVYATLTRDVSTPTVLRKVKDPSAGTTSTQPVSVTLTQAVTVTVLTGTPGSSPALPALPADSGTSYNIPLAYIRVVNGFGAGSILNATDVRDVSNTNHTHPADMSSAMGVVHSRPANGNNDGAGTYATNFPWNMTPGQRPGPWLPPQMTGGEEIVVLLDLMSNSTPSHPSGSIVDSATDWRLRYFLTFAAASNTSHFGSDFNNISGSDSFPRPPAISPSNTVEFQMGNSFEGTSGNPTIYGGTNTSSGGIIGSGAEVFLAVDISTGNLVCTWIGTPACRIFLIVKATAKVPATILN